MRLTKLCKDSGSGDGGCPAAYLTDTAPILYQGPSKHGVVIQGVRADDCADQADNYEAHETLGWVPDNVILRAAPRILWRRAIQAVTR